MQGHTAVGSRRPWRTYQPLAVFDLFILEVDDHPMQVIVKSSGHLFAHPPDFLKELVLHDAGFTISSRGVQITGISNPAC